MMIIKLFNKIDNAGLDLFGENYTLSEDATDYKGILVRSAALHEVQFPSSLKAIARAGAGVNNIPTEKCAEKGIVVFNTPGANANGVKELAVAALMLGSRDIAGGIEWAKTLKGTGDVTKLVEKGKSAFMGPEVMGKTLGVIGLGAIGGMVANVAYTLGMRVVGFDPYITVNAAWGLSRAVIKANNYDEVYSVSDYITIHAPSTDETKKMINADTIAKMKDGVRIINLSRGDLVNEDDLVAALESGRIASYVTDFPSDKILGVKGVICIPHLGASTPESEENCARMAAEELIDYLENGNITNSVNFPSITQPRNTAYRMVVLHRNVPAMLGSISTVLGGDKVNIESLSNRSKGNYAVSIIDADSKITESVIKDVESIEGVIRVNVVE
ncbi:MAG: 3-phosphoglycerate dehydrogenase family protein [Eubacteriales bacterium]|nr:3-phosphoglycerate dehydrogenase family protein [Eubacteriales bacterium]